MGPINKKRTSAKKLLQWSIVLSCFGLLGTALAQNPSPLPLPELPPLEVAPPKMEVGKPISTGSTKHGKIPALEVESTPLVPPPAPKPIPVPDIGAPLSAPKLLPLKNGPSERASTAENTGTLIPEIPTIPEPPKIVQVSAVTQGEVPGQKTAQKSNPPGIPDLPPVSPPVLKTSGVPSQQPVPNPSKNLANENESSDPPPSFQPLTVMPSTGNSGELKPTLPVPVENSTSQKPSPVQAVIEQPATPEPLPQIVSADGPVLVIEKTGTSTGYVGDTLKYEIIVRNQGNGAAKKIIVTEIIPVGAELVQTVPPAIVQNSHLSWKIDLLEPNTEQRFEVKVRALTAGDLRLEASAYLRVNQKEWTTKIQERPLKLEVQTNSEVVTGQKVPVKITVANNGQAPKQNLLLIMAIPEGLKHPVGNEIEAELPTIEPGKTKVIDVNLEAVKTGLYSVDIQVKSPTGDKLVHQASVSVKDLPGLLLKKIGVPVLVKGKVNEYRLEIINQSGYDAKNVVVTEHISDAIEFIAASDRGIYNPKTKTIQWILGTIHPGQSKAIGLKLQGKIPGESQNKVTAEATGGVRVDLSASLLIQDAVQQTPAGPLGFLQPLFKRE